MSRHTIRFAAAGLLALGSLAGFAGAAQAEPIDYVRVELLELTCHQQSEGDHDEAYIKITDANGNQVKVWPGSGKYQTMGTNYLRSLGDANGNAALVLGKQQARTLTLWDFDSTSSDDKLGSTLVTGSEAGGEVQYRSLEGSGGVYTIAYRVIDI
ncbi:hypothetical protein AB0P12_00405 [Streptomyces subrutilus]|uniref:Allene oxide cyclase barrel-like domain-containing protein n=1 Tax=Streptomyces subrutilus TaxID=36818 RepID=A0A5P2UF53_9ACTN|nr:hypothetical protein [Streptomyces subrutilus]QEU77873.1 hypothetical protein CP968_05890 [Streptomyces subrutilus]WSJ32985.1 hypothetical protein OG479_28855 [Streptomyces subrutilus]GGZ62964.1 hypothetical protein GCM10010371_23050 [Streptomyces subrutilus]